MQRCKMMCFTLQSKQNRSAPCKASTMKEIRYFPISVFFSFKTKKENGTTCNIDTKNVLSINKPGRQQV